jgi:hypothetical protein
MPGPVFSDLGGWRARWLGIGGRVVGVAVVLYLGLFGASLVGASWVPHVGLPSLGRSLAAGSPTKRLALPANAGVLPTPDLHAVVKAGGAATVVAPGELTPGSAPGSSRRLTPGSTSVPPAVTTSTTIPATTTTVVRHGSSVTTAPPGNSAHATTTTPGRSGTTPGHARQP